MLRLPPQQAEHRGLLGAPVALIPATPDRAALSMTGLEGFNQTEPTTVPRITMCGGQKLETINEVSTDVNPVLERMQAEKRRVALNSLFAALGITVLKLLVGV